MFGFMALVLGFGALGCLAGLLGSGTVHSKLILLEYRSGEPCSPASRQTWTRVYPRACGGTAACSSVHPIILGLSPRVRGNHGQPTLRLGDHGSIPARAGEPSFSECMATRWSLYPRACGGTRSFDGAGDGVKPLSPRVRGNPAVAAWTVVAQRSIPARAGEPIPAVRPPGGHRVYPRACGGTACNPDRPPVFEGLSPRVRGNHSRPDL